ncbi:MAG: ParB/RepB/Spo0J family partition protein [Phaeodactylibacter sp.]|uniref:ParB/RepB/Spo0J family partition protein n=1 Tax=Phaeodactylibacter sp. TaxID=1940289 RepID=UPI0032EB6DB1
MAKRISKKRKTSADDLRSSLRTAAGKGSSSGGRLSYFNITEEDIQNDPAGVSKELANTVAMLPVVQIAPNPDQPRKEFEPEALQELADSLKTYGLIQPITVRRFNDHEYQIISGERRWRAAQLAKLEEIPAYIRIASDQEMTEMALVENIQRENLNPMEVAFSYHRLIEEFKLSHEMLATRVGKKRATITNYLRLLDVHLEVMKTLKSGDISMGHGRALAGIDDKLLQKQVLDKVLADRLNVRDTERLVRKYSKQNKKKQQLPDSYQRVLNEVRAKLGSGRIDLKLKDEQAGKGQIVLPFGSVEELNQLLDQLDIQI